MIHHVSIGVADLQRAGAFYDAALGALGHVRAWTRETALGYGRPGGGDQLALKLRPDGPSAPGPGFHLAFCAPDRASVVRFHEEAVRHGGRDDGAPGLRPQYGPDYYAAFVVDPDGHRLEAVSSGD